jgi:hypothetical protein
MSALHLASFNGHEREVEFLLSITRNNINLRDSTGAYPIILASMNGHDKIVRLLLEKGADVNATGEKYGMPSMLPLIEDTIRSCGCCSRKEPSSTPKVENMEMPSKPPLVEDMMKSCGYYSRKEPTSTPKVENMEMPSKPPLVEDTIRLCGCCSRKEPMSTPKMAVTETPSSPIIIVRRIILEIVERVQFLTYRLSRELKLHDSSCRWCT